MNYNVYYKLRVKLNQIALFRDAIDKDTHNGSIIISNDNTYIEVSVESYRYHVDNFFKIEIEVNFEDYGPTNTTQEEKEELLKNYFKNIKGFDFIKFETIQKAKTQR